MRIFGGVDPPFGRVKHSLSDVWLQECRFAGVIPLRISHADESLRLRRAARAFWHLQTKGCPGHAKGRIS